MGRHKDKNPGQKVFFHDENGMYATPEEARAAGLDPDQSMQYGSGTTPDFDNEHAYGHTVCNACQRNSREEYLAYRRERDAQRAQEPPPDDPPADEEE